jgi:hypothetical protein
MKLLKVNALQVADIILTTSTGVISRTVRKKTDSDISHAMLLVQAGSVIDSTMDGVQSKSTQRLPFDDDAAVHVLRLVQRPGPEAVSRIVDYARSQIGATYSLMEAARSVKAPARSGTRKQFCSRLVARAYAAGGVNLVPQPDFCTPEDLLSSPLLKEVPDVLREVSQSELDAIARIPDTTARMTSVTNKLLHSIRAIAPGIETLNDVDAYLLAHRSLDDRIDQLFKQSGYLTVWQFEMDKNPWQYSSTAMESVRLIEPEKRRYCADLVADCEASLQRFAVSLAGYSHHFEATGLKTFATKKALYEKLVELHRTRVEVARSWLRKHAPELLPQEAPERSLVPHSQEWFSALEAFNPAQAAMTRAVVAAAGRTDVCSICGDDPAAIYELIGRTSAPGAVKTMRLCVDCWTIRRSMYAESFGFGQAAAQ